MLEGILLIIGVINRVVWFLGGYGYIIRVLFFNMLRGFRWVY